MLVAADNRVVVQILEIFDALAPHFARHVRAKQPHERLEGGRVGVEDLLELPVPGLGNLSTKNRRWDRFFNPEIESRQVSLDRVFSDLYF